MNAVLRGRMLLKATFADVVWVCYKDGETELFTKKKGIDGVDFSIMPPNIGYNKQVVRHVKITVLKWDDPSHRYILVGGIIFACGIPGVTNLYADDDGVFDLHTPPPLTKVWTPCRLRKDRPDEQWHSGNIVPDPASRIILTSNTNEWHFRLWEVDNVYRDAARTIIDDMATRANQHFARNPDHWGPEFDERGFIRQSELRVSRFVFILATVMFPLIIIRDCRWIFHRWQCPGSVSKSVRRTKLESPCTTVLLTWRL